MNKDIVVIFDLDGTLIDTNTLIHSSFKFVFKKYMPEHTLSEDELLSFLGPSLKDTFRRYFKEEMMDELVEYYNLHNLSHHEQYVTIYPTVKKTLESLKEQGYKLAVLTTKRERAAYVGLRLFDLEKYFDVIICGDHLQNQKPDPEGIYKVLSLTKCSKGIMVGDSTSDIMAGKNANVYTIAVDWSPKGTKALEELHPDLMITKMDEIISFVKELKS